MKTKLFFGKSSALVAAACALSAFSGSFASGAFVINEATSLFTPSFRGEENTTYFGWSSVPNGLGGFTGSLGVGGNLPNGTPSINPDSLAGNSFFVQNGTGDVFASSNNVYSGVSGINNAQLVLNIPTEGTIGSDGYTTIIIQGYGQGFYDTITFGAINGIDPEYLYGQTAAPFAHSNGTLTGSTGLFWAKWEIPGNQSSYQVDIYGYSNGIGVVSVSDLIVDTLYSTTGFAADTSVVPEPSSLLSLCAGGLLLFRRSRRA